MQEKDGQSDHDKWSWCAELKKGRCKRKRKRKNQSEERHQIQEPAGDSKGYGAFHANTPQHQRGRHGHYGANDKVAGNKARIIWFRVVMNRAVSILELKRAFIRVAIWSLLQSMKNVRNGTTPAIISTPTQIPLRAPDKQATLAIPSTEPRDFFDGLHVARKASGTLLNFFNPLPNGLNGLLNLRGIHRKFFRKGDGSSIKRVTQQTD